MSEIEDRYAALQARFEEKLAQRTAELAELSLEIGAGEPHALGAARLAAHDLAGSSALFGYAEEGRQAALIEEVILPAIKADRPLASGEIASFQAAVAGLQALRRQRLI